MKKAGTGQHNELANLGSLNVCGNTEEQSAHGTKQCMTYPQGRGLFWEALSMKKYLGIQACYQLNKISPLNTVAKSGNAK